MLKVRHIIDAAESAGEQETVLQLGQRMKPKLIRAKNVEEAKPRESAPE